MTTYKLDLQFNLDFDPQFKLDLDPQFNLDLDPQFKLDLDQQFNLDILPYGNNSTNVCSRTFDHKKIKQDITLTISGTTVRRNQCHLF